MKYSERAAYGLQLYSAFGKVFLRKPYFSHGKVQAAPKNCLEVICFGRKLSLKNF